jgi:hypothetical protein
MLAAAISGFRDEFCDAFYQSLCVQVAGCVIGVLEGRLGKFWAIAMISARKLLA